MISRESNSITALYACLQSLTLALFYVGSLYIFGSPLPRDHPVTVKQRFKRVFVVSLVSPFLVYQWINPDYLNEEGKNYRFVRWLGLHLDNIIIAILLPLVLTLILFFGPIVLKLNGKLEQFLSLGFLRTLKLQLYLSTKDIIWWRTYIVAPFTEELVFRSCMLPLLVPVFGLYPSLFLCPMFFGVAHVHHAIEGIKSGIKSSIVLVNATFQIFYTTVFGAYSAFLFLRTGHLIGPVVCHSFCNFMGFPDFETIPESRYPRATACCFVIGLVSFLFLLFPLTDPLYFASVYWT